MAEFPSMPLYTDAFIADTVHLDATETGAYMMLLMVVWRTPECRLPDDDAKLARFARCSPRVWKKIKPAVMEFWSKDEEGYWIQKRVQREREYVQRKSNKNRHAADARWKNKPLKNHESDNAPAQAAQCEPTPIPKESSPSLRSGEGRAREAEPDEPEPPPQSGRAAKRKPPRPTLDDLVVDETLQRLADQGGFDAEAELERCKDWHRANGRRRKDYRAAARNWFRKAVEERQSKVAYLHPRDPPGSRNGAVSGQERPRGTRGQMAAAKALADECAEEAELEQQAEEASEGDQLSIEDYGGAAEYDPESDDDDELQHERSQGDLPGPAGALRQRHPAGGW